jgi:hypothetical protein
VPTRTDKSKGKLPDNTTVNAKVPTGERGQKRSFEQVVCGNLKCEDTGLPVAKRPLVQSTVGGMLDGVAFVDLSGELSGKEPDVESEVESEVDTEVEVEVETDVDTEVEVEGELEPQTERKGVGSSAVFSTCSDEE